MKALLSNYDIGGVLYVNTFLIDGTGNIVAAAAVASPPASDSLADILSAMQTAAINYASGQGYTIGAGDVISLLSASVVRSFANPTRSLNSAFQISTGQDAMVSYAVDIAATLSLTTGQTGTVVLEYADDSGFTTNVKTVQTSANGNTGTLALGLGLTQTASTSLSGIIPAAKYVRLRTVNTTGTPTFTFKTAQEVLL